MLQYVERKCANVIGSANVAPIVDSFIRISDVCHYSVQQKLQVVCCKEARSFSLKPSVIASLVLYEVGM